jgi:hypothetical protein
MEQTMSKAYLHGLAAAGLLAMAAGAAAQAQQDCAAQIDQTRQQIQEQSLDEQVELELERLLQAAGGAAGEECVGYVDHAQRLMRNAQTEGPERTPRVPPPQPEPQEGQQQGGSPQNAQPGDSSAQNV